MVENLCLRHGAQRKGTSAFDSTILNKSKLRSQIHRKFRESSQIIRGNITEGLNLNNHFTLNTHSHTQLVPNIDLDRLSDSESPIPRKYVWIPPSTINVPSNPSPPEPAPNIFTAEQDTKIILHGGDSLLKKLSKLTLDPPQHQFCGESSRVSFVKTAYKMKSELERSKGHANPPRLGSHRPEFWTNPLVSWGKQTL